ncbi:hypothetical protein [Streptomyces shenzhenensis]|uniref:hypothetical protein n=1 Tax=Streptomyces shenzhenensis TaxID=943815 RepID=UPI001F3D4039|nr:hypothetical protein [Streptomyces shenzhenensis]
MRALLWGALLGLLWVLFPSLVTLAAAVLLAAAVKAVPPALGVALLPRALLPRVRRWTR